MKTILFKLFIIVVLLFIIFPLSTSPILAAPVQQQYNQSKVTWNAIPGAVNYNIYYKESNSKIWQHSVSNLPLTTMYTIRYLKKGVSYKYIVSALDAKKKEFWSSGVKWLKLSSMNTPR